MNNEIVKSAEDEILEQSRQKLLPRSNSLRNNRNPNKIRIVWRTKSNIEYENLEKILGIPTHRRRSAPQSSSIINHKVFASEFINEMAEPERIEVKINKEKIKLFSVKSMKTFFENASCGGEKDDRTYQRVKKIKLHSCFPIIEDIVVAPLTQEQDKNTMKYENTIPQLGKIGRSNAVDEECQKSDDINKNVYDNSQKNQSSLLDETVARSNSAISSLNRSILQMNNRSNSDIDTIANSEPGIISQSSPCYSGPSKPDTKQDKTTPEMHTCINDNGIIKELDNTTNDPGIICEESEFSVSNIKAKWEKIIKESATSKCISPIFNKSIIASKIPARNNYNETITNSVGCLKTNDYDHKKDVESGDDTRSLSSIRQIVRLFELKSAKGKETNEIIKSLPNNVRINKSKMFTGKRILTSEEIISKEAMEPTTSDSTSTLEGSGTIIGIRAVAAKSTESIKELQQTIAEIPEIVIESQITIAETSDPVVESHVIMAETPKDIADSQSIITDTSEPVVESQVTVAKASEPTTELQVTVAKASESTTESQVTVSEASESAIESQVPISESKITIAETQEAIVATPPFIGESRDIIVEPTKIAAKICEPICEIGKVTPSRHESIFEVKPPITNEAESNDTIADDHKEVKHSDILCDVQSFNDTPENMKESRIMMGNVLAPLISKENIMPEVCDKLNTSPESSYKETELPESMNIAKFGYGNISLDNCRQAMDQVLQEPPLTSQPPETMVGRKFDHEDSSLANRKQSEPNSASQSKDGNTGITSTDVSSAKPLLSLIRDDNQLDILRRNNSKLRALHPDEFSYFQNPVLDQTKRGRSSSDISHNRK